MFHAHDGWFFGRGYNNGDVLIEHRVYGTEKNELGELMYTINSKTNIPADMWASIVSTVSATGENRNTWLAARAFHQGVKPLGIIPMADGSEIAFGVDDVVFTEYTDQQRLQKTE